MTKEIKQNKISEFIRCACQGCTESELQVAEENLTGLFLTLKKMCDRIEKEVSTPYDIYKP